MATWFNRKQPGQGGQHAGNSGSGAGDQQGREQPSSRSGQPHSGHPQDNKPAEPGQPQGEHMEAEHASRPSMHEGQHQSMADAARGADPAPEGDTPEDIEFRALLERMSQLEADKDRLETELEATKSRAVRAMADFQNYQRRAASNEVVARQQGVASVANTVVNVIDHFDIALAQDQSRASVEQIVDGLRVIREELLRSLAKHGVSPISPQPNDEFVPGQHEAIMQQSGAGVEPGRVTSTFQSGYVLRDGDTERVLRPAKVSVAPTE